MIAEALQAATQGVGGGAGAGAEKRGLRMPLGPPVLQRAHQWWVKKRRLGAGQN